MKDKQEAAELLSILKIRFLENVKRHPSIRWEDVEARLLGDGNALSVLARMEETGGEPDVLEWGGSQGDISYVDCSKESPAGRRSLCYDRKALDGRKANKPVGSVLDSAREIGIALLSEDQYRRLQERGEFDLKTSSWVVTPEDIRNRGGALFCDRRYGHVFTYHNGADSYYAARGFRGVIGL